MRGDLDLVVLVRIEKFVAPGGAQDRLGDFLRAHLRGDRGKRVSGRRSAAPGQRDQADHERARPLPHHRCPQRSLVRRMSKFDRSPVLSRVSR